MLSFVEELIGSHYQTELGRPQLDRIRQINISVSIDAYAMLKAQSEHFGQSLSAYCADALNHLTHDVLGEVNKISNRDFNRLLSAAGKVASDEAKLRGITDFVDYWTLIKADIDDQETSQDQSEPV